MARSGALWRINDFNNLAIGLAQPGARSGADVARNDFNDLAEGVARSGAGVAQSIR